MNSQIRSGIKGIDNNNSKELKPKFGGKINSKRRMENSKTVLRRNFNDFTQTDDDRPITKSKKRPNSQSKPLRGYAKVAQHSHTKHILKSQKFHPTHSGH